MWFSALLSGALSEFLKLQVFCGCFLLALSLHLSFSCFSPAYIPEEYLLSTNKKRDVDDCSWLSIIC